MCRVRGEDDAWRNQIAGRGLGGDRRVNIGAIRLLRWGSGHEFRAANVCRADHARYISAAPTTPATSPAAPTAPPVRGVVVTVTNVIDGDTIDTTAGRVRLIGIDTPERGDCNYEPAADELLRVIAEQSDQVVLVRGGTDDTDRYDRLLRYVDTVGGRDLNLHMITSGYATARYDSQDGYPRHDREDAYRAADLTSPEQSC